MHEKALFFCSFPNPVENTFVQFIILSNFDTVSGVSLNAFYVVKLGFFRPLYIYGYILFYCFCW